VIEERAVGRVDGPARQYLVGDAPRRAPHRIFAAVARQRVDALDRAQVRIAGIPAAELPGFAHRLGRESAMPSRLAPVVDDVADGAHSLLAAAARLAPHGERHPVGVDDVEVGIRDEVGGGRTGGRRAPEAVGPGAPADFALRRLGRLGRTGRVRAALRLRGEQDQAGQAGGRQRESDHGSLPPTRADSGLL
jgi:hypothetical protein